MTAAGCQLHANLCKHCSQDGCPDTACVCRKALHLLRHVLHAHAPDAIAACQLGAVQQAASQLASPDDDTWQAALALVQQLAQDTDAAQHLRQVLILHVHMLR